MPSVAVVILNYNGRKILEQFLPSVVANSNSHAIVIIDNQSTDDSVAFIQKNYPSIQIIQLDKNYGYSKGYNLGLEQISADYFILLNSDVEVTPNWIDPVIVLMEKNLSMAVCQPKIKSYVDRSSFEYAGAGGGYIDYLGYPFCRGRLFSEVEKDTHQYDDQQDIFWASGACFFIKSFLFKEMDGFDPDFFAHMEEIDLCWRLKSKGYRITYCPDSTIYHLGGGTLSQTSPKKMYLNFRNSLWMLAKNLPYRQLFYKIPIRFLMDGLFVVHRSFKLSVQIVKSVRGNWKNIKPLLKEMIIIIWYVVKAHFIFIFSWKRILEKRKKLASKTIQLDEIYFRSIVFQHFLWRKLTFKQLRWREKKC